MVASVLLPAGLELWSSAALLRRVGGGDAGRGRGEELEEEVGRMESEGRGDRGEESGRQLQHGPRLNELLGTILLGCPGEAGLSQATSRGSGGTQDGRVGLCKVSGEC